MTILAYGEDALTLWALAHRLPEILRALNDPSPPEEALAVFRPSFGRRGASAAAQGASLSSQFGEFDAIIGTGTQVVLVEAKWGNSSELRDGVLSLRPEQVRRHEILRWYLARWRSHGPTDWPSFHDGYAEEFRERFPGMSVPRSGTVLARNLEYLLGRLAGRAEVVQDALLYLTGPGQPVPQTILPEHFRLVPIECSDLRGSGFVEIVVRGSPAVDAVIEFGNRTPG